jgi:hypothetical protein
MGFGIFPFAFYLCWVGAIFATLAPGRAPIVPMIDPLGMVGVGMSSFGAALVVAAPATWWSWSLARGFPELRSRAALAFQCLVVLLLASPFIWMFGQKLALG